MLMKIVIIYIHIYIYIYINIKALNSKQYTGILFDIETFRSLDQTKMLLSTKLTPLDKDYDKKKKKKKIVKFVAPSICV